ncbi:beta-lactamase-like protein [Cytidiella melzeri]|nr:beta-lactamase-like protein [Cytidiella melzeri]
MPLAHLLQVEDVRILLDCGLPDCCPEMEEVDWGEERRPAGVYGWEYCRGLRKNASSIDLVLLSHGDLAHSGLYAYAYAHWGLTAPAYTTWPGEESLAQGDEDADHKEVKMADREKKKYVASVQEVHEAFASITVLRFSQPCHLQEKCQGLTIMPFNAGHTLVGTTILYAVDKNHIRERHRDGTRYDPKLILAIPASLPHGASRAIFADFAQTETSVVLLTGRGEEVTLGRTLFGRWNNQQREEYKRDRGKIGNNKQPQEPPSKFITTVAEVQLACRLLFVDVESLNDGRAVKTIVPQVNPRMMIIVYAPAGATDHLMDSCSGIRAMTKDIYAPAQGERIQIGQHTNSFSISLSDELLASIKMSRACIFQQHDTFEDNEVGHVTGRIATIATNTIPIFEPVSASAAHESRSKRAVRGRMLGARPRMSHPQSTPIGEPKLTALKTRLATVGVQAELIGEGVLICGAAARRGGMPDSLEDSIAVKKTARAMVDLEGPVSDVYYVVCREVYHLHALVAA